MNLKDTIVKGSMISLIIILLIFTVHSYIWIYLKIKKQVGPPYKGIQREVFCEDDRIIIRYINSRTQDIMAVEEINDLEDKRFYEEKCNAGTI